MSFSPISDSNQITNIQNNIQNNAQNNKEIVHSQPNLAGKTVSFNKNIMINAGFALASSYCAYRGVQEHSYKWTTACVGLSIIGIIAATFSVDMPSRERCASLRRIQKENQ